MSDLRIQVHVEPLPDARVARVRHEVIATLEAERRLRSAARATPRRRQLAVLAACLAAAAVLVAVLAQPWLRRATGDELRLATTDSASEFTLGESSLEVAPRSTLLVTGDDRRGVHVLLERGAVTCVVPPRGGRPPFVVDAGDVRVRVVGTRFTVEREGAGARVRVDHGAVELQSRAEMVTLRDGEAWPIVAAVVPVPPPPEATAPPAAAPEASALSAGPKRAAPPRARAPRRSGKPPPAVAPAASPEHVETPAPSAEPTVAAPAPPPPPPPPPSPREVFESAARLERSRPDEAAVLYRQVAEGPSAWAPNALYALARLDADRGNVAEARQWLNEYLVRYPRGQNAQDAHALLDRLR
jgi:hypothetical protein